jgi:hypothetical protein
MTGTDGTVPHGTRISTPCLIALCTLVLATGCGSSAKPAGGPADVVSAPHGAVQAAKVWAQAVGTGDCATLSRLSFAPLSKLRCRALLAALPAPTVEGVAQYGPVILADVTLLTGRQAAAVFMRRGTGWAFTNAIPTGRRIVGTRPLDSGAALAMLARVLPAIAKGSCTTVANDFQAATLKPAKASAQPASSTLRPETPTAANCFDLNGSSFQTRLQHGMSAPTALGANARIAFYTIGTGRGLRYPTILSVLELHHTPLFFREYISSERLPGATRH